MSFLLADQSLLFHRLTVAIVGVLMGRDFLQSAEQFAPLPCIAVLGVLFRGQIGLGASQFLNIAAVAMCMLTAVTAALASVVVDVPYLGAVLRTVLVMGMPLFESARALAIAVVGVLVLLTIQIFVIALVTMGMLNGLSMIAIQDIAIAPCIALVAMGVAFLGHFTDQGLYRGDFIAILVMHMLGTGALQLGLNGSRQRGEHHAGAQGEGHHDR
jgi:hypothetical protein